MTEFGKHLTATEQTVDGVWIGEWIYWPLLHTTRN
jgi:hypothetical protein